MELVGLAEIASLIGATKQVVSNWRTRKPGFPAAVAELKSGPVWDRDVIVKWVKKEGLTLAEQTKPEGQLKKFASRNARSVAIMNMKGGVGKSTLAANFGWYAAHERDRRVLLVDLDPQFNLSQYILGAQGYEKLLDQKRPTVEALFRDTHAPGRPASIRKTIVKVVDYRDGSCVHLIPANLELAWTIKNALDRATYFEKLPGGGPKRLRPHPNRLRSDGIDLVYGCIFRCRLYFCSGEARISLHHRLASSPEVIGRLRSDSWGGARARTWRHYIQRHIGQSRA